MPKKTARRAARVANRQLRKDHNIAQIAQAVRQARIDQTKP